MARFIHIYRIWNNINFFVSYEQLNVTFSPVQKRWVSIIEGSVLQLHFPLYISNCDRWKKTILPKHVAPFIPVYCMILCNSMSAFILLPEFYISKCLLKYLQSALTQTITVGLNALFITIYCKKGYNC